MINVPKGVLILGLQHEKVTFNVVKAFKDPLESELGKEVLKAIKQWGDSKKVCRIQPEPTQFKHQVTVASSYCHGRMPKSKDIEKELPGPKLYRNHYTKGNEMEDDERPATNRHCNKSKFALGWSIDDIK